MGKKHEGEEAEPTKKQELRDAKGLIRGTHDGILVIENQKPKLTGPMVEANKGFIGVAASTSHSKGFSPIENAKS
jgi:hypothetical protein